MKKSIVIVIFLLFVLGWLIALNVYFWNNFYIEMLFTKTNPEYGYPTHDLTYSIFSLLTAIATLVAMIITAIKDFPVFKPLVDKLSAKRAAHKEARDTAKAEKAEANKQARIEQLQAELEELKKDE